MALNELREWAGNNKALATWAVCALGGFSMWVSRGTTGIGWAIIGIWLIWG